MFECIVGIAEKIPCGKSATYREYIFACLKNRNHKNADCNWISNCQREFFVQHRNSTKMEITCEKKFIIFIQHQKHEKCQEWDCMNLTNRFFTKTVGSPLCEYYFKIIAPLYITFGFLQKLFLTPSATTLHLTIPKVMFFWQTGENRFEIGQSYEELWPFESS
jgi:hypothetical protein